MRSNRQEQIRKAASEVVEQNEESKHPLTSFFKRIYKAITNSVGDDE